MRRAAVPIAYSQGFTPHPKISYASTTPTGVASEAEYLEIGLRARADPEQVRAALDAALSPGLDVLEVVEAHGGSLAERIDGSCWRIELDGVAVDRLTAAVAAFLNTPEVLVERLTKQGRRRDVPCMTSRAAGWKCPAISCVTAPGRGSWRSAIPSTTISGTT